MSQETDLKYWVALHRVQGLGPVRFGRIETYFGNMEAAWSASRLQLREAGLENAYVEELDRLRRETSPDGELEKLDQLGIQPVYLRSPEYPESLREIFDPPSVLYVKGVVPVEHTHSVAVVGSRRPTPYGREMSRRLSAELASSGVTVYSGLARGIDGIAHRAAVDTDGQTVAVVGGGLDSIYPAEHTELAQDIVNHGGAVVTEYPVGTRPKPEHFPRRNRVISGLTRGVVVVEGKRTSGAMLTVKWALEQDREVFAVPGNVLSENSDGPNWLIQQGAKLVTSGHDVLEELGIKPTDPTGRAKTNKARSAGTQDQLGVDSLARENNEINIEGRIVDFIAASGGTAHVDDITRSASTTASVVSSALTVLELRGVLRQVGPMLFAIEPGSAQSDFRR
jgi:DNA processing protein